MVLSIDRGFYSKSKIKNSVERVSYLLATLARSAAPYNNNPEILYIAPIDHNYTSVEYIVRRVGWNLRHGKLQGINGPVTSVKRTVEAGFYCNL